MKGRIGILIADDHSVVRMGIAALVGSQKDMEVVGEARNGEEAVRLCGKLAPDVVLMDLMMPKLDGIEATRRIRSLPPPQASQIPHILILTTFATSDAIAKALEAGADGAVMKSIDNAELLRTIRAVARGEKRISGDIEQLLKEDPPVTELTPRQLEILASITRGLSNEDIAKLLNLALPTVKNHVVALFEKIGAANRAEAAAIAVRKHLLKV